MTPSDITNTFLNPEFDVTLVVATFVLSIIRLFWKSDKPVVKLVYWFLPLIFKYLMRYYRDGHVHEKIMRWEQEVRLLKTHQRHDKGKKIG